MFNTQTQFLFPVFLCATLASSPLHADDTSPAPAVQTADASTIETFRQLCHAQAAAANKAYRITVPGDDGWLFFAPELRSIGAGTFWGDAAATADQSPEKDAADPLPAILDFKAQLDKLGIDFIFMPVPLKPFIYADEVSGTTVPKGAAMPRLDTAHQEFYALLRQNGVNVLDLTDEFLAHRLDSSGLLYCKQDTHWSGRACVMAARRVAAEIAAKPWLGAARKNVKYQQRWKKVAFPGDLWDALVAARKPPQEAVALRFIGTPPTSPQAVKAAAATGGLTPVADDKDSPILLLGDSHDLVFHVGEDLHVKGAGLADQLALELGFPVDVMAVRGSGATPARKNLARRVQSHPGYLRHKKLVIWCFSSREFTESMGWQKVALGGG